MKRIVIASCLTVALVGVGGGSRASQGVALADNGGTTGQANACAHHAANGGKSHAYGLQCAAITTTVVYNYGIPFITVTGSDFAPNSQVTVTLTSLNAGYACKLSLTYPTDNAGSFTANQIQFGLIRQPSCLPATVTVTDAAGNSADSQIRGLATGSATVTPSVTPSSGAYYGEEDLTVNATTPLTAFHATVTVQKTTGLSFAGQFTSFPAGAVTVDHTETGSTIAYTYDLAPGRTIPAGSYSIGTQFNGNGSFHDFIADTFTVTANAGSGSTTSSGHFTPPAGVTPPPAAQVTTSASVTPGSGAYYTEEDVALKTAAALTAFHLVVTIQKATGASFAGQYTTFPAAAVTAGHTETASSIQYTYDLAPGQTIPAGSYIIGNAISGDGHSHSFDLDAYSGTATSSGSSVTFSGHIHL